MAIAYWVVVFLGAFTLVVEAYRQFKKPSVVQAHDRYPILSDVNIQDLCTPGEHMRGFIVYVSLYLGAYVTILGSAEVYEIVSESPGAVGFTVGASDSSDDLAGFASNNSELGKPIFVSAIIIAALSMGVFAPIERSLRAYAHWIAGIPRGIYRVISRMDEKFDSSNENRFNTPLADTFDSHFKALPENPTIESSIRDIRKTLIAIDLIEPAVTGNMRGRLFNSLAPSTIDNLLAKQKLDHDIFEAELHELTNTYSKELETPISENELKTILSGFLARSMVMRNNHQALFAILYLRNEKQIELLTKSNAPELSITDIVRDIAESKDPAFNALVGAVFLMSLVIGCLYPLALYYTRPPVEIVSDAVLYGIVRNETILAILFHALLFSMCASMAVLTRETSKEYGRWKDWRLREAPFGRFAKHCFFPGVTAVVICVLVKLVEYSTSVADGTFDQFVRTNWAFCLMHFVSGGLIAMTVFAVLDQHGPSRALRTIFIALGFIAPYLLWALFIQSLDIYKPLHFDSDFRWRVREIGLLWVAPIFFALFFASLIELSEKATTSNAPSVTSRQFKANKKRQKELEVLEKRLNTRDDAITQKEAEVQEKLAEIANMQSGGSNVRTVSEGKSTEQKADV